MQRSLRIVPVGFSALVEVDQERCEKWMRRNGVPEEDFESVLNLVEYARSIWDNNNKAAAFDADDAKELICIDACERKSIGNFDP